MVDGGGLFFNFLGLVPLLEHAVDELSHAFFAFEAGALDALKALRIWLFSKHLFLIGQHFLNSSFSRIYRK